MGQRANLVLPIGDTYALYYTHWDANVLDKRLFWGPDAALDYAASLERVDHESGWLDEVWAEGGALIDVSRRRLLFYGGEDLKYDVDMRRLYFKLMRYTWQGWTTNWAYQGFFDIVRYVGLDTSRFIAHRSDAVDLDRLRLDNPTHPAHPENPYPVCSLRTADGLVRVYRPELDLESLMRSGPELATRLDSSRGLGRLDVELPVGGLNIDLDVRQIEYWKAAPEKLPSRVQEAWPGWTVVSHHDFYERQVELAEGHLSFRTKPEHERLRDLGELLLGTTGDGALRVMEIAETLSREGQKVELNPAALQSSGDELSLDEKRRIMAGVLASYSSDNA